jgi:DNA mismatch repair protein MutL
VSSSGGRRVHVLPDDLANQIAAGEVVERPASVVKELVENALDAGARRIRVDLANGGVQLVRVADDGGGMDRDDATLAVLRHATSKIGSIGDLHAIRSFGFRGEALPSIASVSRFVLRTRRHEDDEGTEVRIEGGGPATIGPCGCAAGTSVEVRDLFYNVPARRKFLRAIATESAHVTDVVEWAALSRPDVTMILSRDGRVAREWLRSSGREERARDVMDDEPLSACSGTRGALSVEAFLSRPERARSGATRLLFFVNGRPVKDRTLARIVANAYGSVLEPGRYPVGVVYLDLPAEVVDVNVHPQKAEVRFADARAVQDALFKIIATPLSRAFGLPAPGAHPWAGHGQRKQKPEPDDDKPPQVTWSGSGRLPGILGPPGTPWRGDGWLPVTETKAPEAPPAPAPQNAPASPPPAPEPDPWGLVGDTAPAEEIRPPEPPAARPITPQPATTMPARPMPYPTASERLQIADRPSAYGALTFVAQVRRTFLVCEGPDGLYVMDQHAAAERVTFDRLRRAYETRAVASQRLLIPEIVRVTAAEGALIEEAQEEIGRAGFEISLAGPGQAAVGAVPQILAGRVSPEQLLRDLLAELGRAGERALSGAVDLALATMACHGSVRAGDAMAREEVAALLGALDDVDFAGHCPHGRPVVMKIRWAELEQKVGRR